MKRITFIIILISALSFSALGARQSEAAVSGRVIDKESGEPVGWATVALMKADSTIVAGTTCSEKGAYLMKAVPGNYFLVASLIGYKDYSRQVSIDAGASELPDIVLETDAQMIAGAKVTERVKLVEMKIDKVVMNIKESAFAQGSNALELIKKAPGVTVDKDGNILLNGKQVSVWIDGRPSYMDGKSLESLLRSSDGGSIDKFELMEHPSSKYDAAGQGGIINIKTKKNFLQGFNGSVGLGGGGMYYRKENQTPWEQSFRANLAYRTEKTNTFLNINEGMYHFPMQLINDLTIESLDFLQNSSTALNNLYHNHTFKVGNDWFIDKNNTLGVILYIPGSYSTFNSDRSNATQTVGGVLTEKSSSQIKNGPSHSLRTNLNLNYTHIFDEARSAELTANLDYYHNTSRESNSQTDTTTDIAASLPPAVTSQSVLANNKYDIYSAKADYQSVVWKKFMLEAGAKWAYSRTDNNSVETYTPGPVNPMDFVYSEHIGAIYASLAGQPGPKWSFKAGLRGEYTNSFGDWKTAGTRTSRQYFDLFPTAYIGFTPNQNWRLSASYTRRISRPFYDALNPTKTYIDAKTYTMGDPDLLPQYSNGVSLSAGLGQHLSWSIGYNGAKNVINQIPKFNPDGTQCMTYGNAGKYDMGSASFGIAALPVGKWLQWTFNVYGMLGKMTSSVSGAGYSNISASGYTDFTFVLPKDWKIDLDGYFSTPMTFGYIKMLSSWSSNMAIKKNLLDGKLILALKVEDIFRSGTNNIEFIDESGSGAISSIKQLYCNQQILIDITWNFGKTQNPSRRRNVGNLEEMSRVGSGGQGGTGSSIGM